MANAEMHFTLVSTGVHADFAKCLWSKHQDFVKGSALFVSRFPKWE